MKKNKLLILLLLLVLVFSSPVYAEDNDDMDIKSMSKTAELNEEENIITIDIQTQYEKRPIKTLVFQGTFCKAHGLTDQILVNTLSALVQNGDVDYYAETVHYSTGKTKEGPLKSFIKGQTITTNDIYKTVSENGNHIINEKILKGIYDKLKTGNYDYLIMILDGGFATGASGGSTSAIFNVKNNLRLSDDEYIERLEIAKFLKDFPVLYVLSPLGNSDEKITWDGQATLSYKNIRSYWDSKYNASTFSQNSLRYLNVHLFVEGLAFLAPNYYVDIVDPDTGKYTKLEPPTNSEIKYPEDKFVSYNNGQDVVEKVEKSKDYYVSTTTTIKDVLAEGLSYNSSKVQVYNESISDWEDIVTTSDVDVDIQVAGQTITATIKDKNAIYNGKKMRLVIETTPSEEFGSTGEETKTNEDCMVTYENEEGVVISEQHQESPSVKFTILDVIYHKGDNGILTGIEKESFKKGTNEKISGSEVVANEHYTHTGWLCDKDVLLDDNTTIKQGNLITNDKLKSIIANDNLTFTAQYEKEKYNVTYEVTGDEKYGIPSDVNIPLDDEQYEYDDLVKIKDQITTSWTTSDGTENGIPGVWKFEFFDKEDFRIREDTVVKGSWAFFPEEEKNVPKTGDNLYKYVIILIISTIGIAATLILKKQTYNS